MEDFVINHFFTICQIIIYVGIAILIYSIEKKGCNKKSNKEINTILPNNVNNKKNVGRDIGFVVIIIGIVLFIIGIIMLCIGIWFIIELGIFFYTCRSFG